MSAVAISPPSNLENKRRSGRCQKRMRMVASVRLWMPDAPAPLPQWAHTLDVTPGGTRLAGLNCELRPGMIVEVQRQHKRARFCVVWAQHPDEKSKEMQVGLKCLEPEKHIWGVDIPEEADTYEA
jgi:hypothetical protein